MVAMSTIAGLAGQLVCNETSPEGSRETLWCPYSMPNTSLPGPPSYFKEVCVGEEDEKATWLIGLGIALGSFGSIGINVGNNLQSLAFTKMNKEFAVGRDGVSPSICRVFPAINPLWSRDGSERTGES